MKQDNEKQAIEEMAKDFCALDMDCNECHLFENNCHAKKYAGRAYKAGYRKQSVVIDEFAKRLKEKMDDISRMEYHGVSYFLVSKSFIDKIAAEMKGGE